MLSTRVIITLFKHINATLLVVVEYFPLMETSLTYENIVFELAK